VHDAGAVLGTGIGHLDEGSLEQNGWGPSLGCGPMIGSTLFAELNCVQLSGPL